MDDSRFDTLARALVTGHTRRGLGWLLGGLPFSGLLALFGLAETEAKHKKHKHKKKKKKKHSGSPPVPSPSSPPVSPPVSPPPPPPSGFA